MNDCPRAQFIRIHHGFLSRLALRRLCLLITQQLISEELLAACSPQLSEQKCIFISLDLRIFGILASASTNRPQQHMPCCIRQINYADFIWEGHLYVWLSNGNADKLIRSTMCVCVCVWESITPRNSEFQIQNAERGLGFRLLETKTLRLLKYLLK